MFLHEGNSSVRLSCRVSTWNSHLKLLTSQMYHLTSHGVSEDFTKSYSCCGRRWVWIRNQESAAMAALHEVTTQPCFSKARGVYQFTQVLQPTGNRDQEPALFLSRSSEKCIHFSFCPRKSFLFFSLHLFPNTYLTWISPPCRHNGFLHITYVK